MRIYFKNKDSITVLVNQLKIFLEIILHIDF